MTNGLEILLHMGIDTVELNGAPFTIKVKEGDQVTADTVVAIADLELKQLVKELKWLSLLPTWIK